MRTVGILLAGGQSSRFGSPKAFATIQGEYFYERSYRLLDEICDEVTIATRDELLPRFPKHMNVITDCDDFKGNGPLSGIYSAMLREPADRYIVLPCDMPFLTTTGMKALLRTVTSDAVYAIKRDDEYHPLVSCWPGAIRASIRQALEQKQYSVMKLLANTDVVWLNGEVLFDNAFHILQNINKQEQMKEVNSHDSISRRQIP